MMERWWDTSAAVTLSKWVLSFIAPIEESFFFRRGGRKTVVSTGALRTSVWEHATYFFLIMSVVGAIFIPRIPLGGFSHYYSLDLKIEDLALAVLMLVFFIARPPDVFSPWRHAIAVCFLWFLLVACLSIGVGMWAGTLDKPLMSLLYLVKWFEYFWIFFFSARLSQTAGSQRMINLFFWMGLALAAYGYYEHFYPISAAAYPNYYRLYERPPFHGDANHVGGILAMWLAFFSYVFLRGASFLSLRARCFFGGCGNPALEIASSTASSRNDKAGWSPLILLVTLFLVFFPLIWTFSRKSYFALAGAYVFLFFLPGVSRRRWIFLACLLTCAGLLLPTRLAERVSDIGAVMSAVDPYHSSWAGNMDVWKRCFWNFDQFWLFGAGLGARHRLFYESQYVLTLTETGLFGFVAFAALLLAPAIYALRRIKTHGMHQGLLAGAWLSAWAAFMLHNLSCVSLTVSKCAVIWWFLTGALIGGIKKEENA